MSNSTKILVVDDEPIGRQLLEAILIPEGYQIFFGTDGEEALQLATREQPDIILLDVMMPKKDGFETCREIRNNNITAHIPVFLITALDDRDSRIRGIDAGADDYISKPFDRVEILAKIKNKSTQIDVRKKEQVRRVGDIIDKSDSSGISLVDLLIEMVYAKEKSNKEFTVFHSVRKSHSRHSVYCHVRAEARYYLILSNKLPDKDAAIANALVSRYFDQFLNVNSGTTSSLRLKLVSGIKTMLTEVGIPEKHESGFSFAIIKIDDDKLYATGQGQSLFICRSVSNDGNGKFRSVQLNDAAELTFGLSSILILLSPNIFENYQTDEILNFLDNHFSLPTNTPPNDIIRQEYSDLMDYQVVKLIV